jgi:ribose/xylose/arabinose/galactoside ABC-type transport system permease subunit
VENFIQPCKTAMYFFNLFINDASLLLVSIGMTMVILTGGIDLSLVV